jgi:broad specificity phosphatase PhoE
VQRSGHNRSVIVSCERVLLARHGQTEWNLVGRRQGQLDSRLTERGVEQAGRSAAVLRGHAVDAVFTSPLGRAVSTAEIFARALSAAVVVVDELAEVHHGRFAGLTDGEIERRHLGEWGRRARNKYYWRFPGGESYADADRRAAAALALIDRHRADRPLIVSHEMVGRMLLHHLLDLDPCDALGRRHPHDVVYEVAPHTGSLRELLSPGH